MRTFLGVVLIGLVSVGDAPGAAAAPGAARAQGAELYVVCNASVPLTPADVHDLFLGEKQYAGALKLVPVDNSAAQTLFLEKMLRMNAAKYATTWTKKSFRDGVNPPLVAGGDSEALAYVRRTRGACSYVTSPIAADLPVVWHL